MNDDLDRNFMELSCSARKEHLEFVSDNNSRNNTKKNISKPFAFYCLMTFCIMLLFLAFAATEIFSLFFSEGYIGGTFMSKIFGSDGTSGMDFREIMLNQCFSDLSYKTETNEGGKPSDTGSSDENNDIIPPQNNNENIQQKPSNDDTPDTSENGYKDIYKYDFSNIPDGLAGIMPMDLSLIQYGIDYINDQSSASFDTKELKDISVSVGTSGVYPTGAPLVLIVHTHGTEAFTPQGINYYDPLSEIARSENKNENIVSCGEIMAQILNQEGIPTIHCEIMHDAEGYTGSYDRSGETIKEYLKEYPSIQYVIDLHRDAVIRSSGELIKPVTYTKEGVAAQIMCVVGTGINSDDNITWRRNLALAQQLREKLSLESENICRPTCLRDSSYNQQYSVYSLLIEIGAAGNTKEEALLATKTAAHALAAVIKGI